MAKQTQTITVNSGVEETFAALKNAIAKLKYSVESYDDAAHVAHIKTGVSAFSWGEKITVTVTPSATGGSNVELASAPKLATNVVDMGRGSRLLTSIANALTAELSPQTQEVIEATVVEPGPAPAPSASAADEIKKLAELKEQGILTEEEFAAKKKQLLNI